MSAASRDHLSRGLAHEAQGDYPRAVAEYTSAIKQNPQGFSAYLHRGCARGKTGDLDGALADFNEVIKLRPENALGYCNRGIARGKRGDRDGARADYTEAIARDPGYCEAYFNRGALRLEAGDLDGALADFTRVIELLPAFAEGYVQRAKVRQQREDWAGTVADYSRVLEIEPRDVRAWAGRGLAHLRQGEDERAERDFAQVLRLRPDLRTSLDNQIREVLAGRPEGVDVSVEAGPALPAAPPGYSWELAGQSRAYFLRPDGWHFTAREQGDALTYFLTREPPGANAETGLPEFETGFTIQIGRQTSKAVGLSPSEFARAYVQRVVEAADQEVEDTWQNAAGPLVGFGVQFSSATESGRLRERHLLIGNDTTETLYVITFEAPADSWDRDWPVASKVFKHLRLRADV